MTEVRRIALCGNPNSGKSTLFNTLTGLSQKTANIPGVTVEKKTGRFEHQGQRFVLEDIPGIYSLNARSADEKIATDLILDDQPDAPEFFVFVADSTQLRKSLFLFFQMQEAGCPMILALNMHDIALKQGLRIDTEELERELDVPVLPISASKKTGINELLDSCGRFPHTTRRTAAIESTAAQCYERIDSILSKSISGQTKTGPARRTETWDRLALHPVWGYLIFFALLFLTFQAVFFLAEFPRNWIELAFIRLGDLLTESLDPGTIQSLLVSGVLPGLSGVLMFVPQIAILFFFLVLLEDSGYMVRASLLMDKIMTRAGLNGRSVIPLISGVACAIPAIMATRTIAQPRERLITMFVIPFISCSARLPVFILLVSLILPDERFLGVFNYQGLALTALYFAGFAAAFGSAFLLKRSLKKDRSGLFLMEVPDYRKPHWPVVWRQIWQRSLSFITGAGKVILVVSILLWALSSYGPGDFTGKYAGEPTPLEESFAGIGGRLIEPVIRPLGYDWKIGVAIIASFAAREVFVGSISTLYHVADPEDRQGILSILSGPEGISAATAVSLLLFYLFALQCSSTIVIMKRETGGWKWPVIQFVYMAALAYFSALIAYQLLS